MSKNEKPVVFNPQAIDVCLAWHPIPFQDESRNPEKALGLFLCMQNNSGQHFRRLDISYGKYWWTNAARFSLAHRISTPLPYLLQQEDFDLPPPNKPLINDAFFEDVAPNDSRAALLDIAKWEAPFFFWIAPLSIQVTLPSNDFYKCEEYLSQKPAGDSIKEHPPCELSLRPGPYCFNAFALLPKSKGPCRSSAFPSQSPS